MDPALGIEPANGQQTLYLGDSMPDTTVSSKSSLFHKTSAGCPYCHSLTRLYAQPVGPGSRISFSSSPVRGSRCSTLPIPQCNQVMMIIQMYNENSLLVLFWVPLDGFIVHYSEFRGKHPRKNQERYRFIWFGKESETVTF